ncbi:SLC2A4 regulator [Spea bombifrons]|uniref:SLC2A4 regulator n=1 Tax=Spea bombifrons TaxID=233779 RepID=UPI0023491E77|nr:SLC2A4 regulator [Spea bombifrons]
MAAVSVGTRNRPATHTGVIPAARGRVPETAQDARNREQPEVSVNSGSSRGPDYVASSRTGLYRGPPEHQETESPQTDSARSRSLGLPSSSVIPVPKHRLDEAIAAAALTSLSSGPLVLKVGTSLTGGSREPYGEKAANSSSCSSINSCDLYRDTSVPSTPSPPLRPAPLSAGLDGGIEDSDTTHFLFGDPVPRKRKNSGRLMFRCLWKNCEKVLSTSSAIQKHIRAAHLGRCTEQEHNDGEEDFYYTEMDVNVDTLSDGLSSLTPTSPTTAGPPAFPCPGSLGAAHGSDLPLVSPLSLSAPSTLCHVHADHAYQALSPASLSAAPTVSFSWQSPPLLIKAPPVCPVLGVNERRPPILTSTSVQKHGPGARKPRGEAKKCRKVYGMERKDMWCTACRWKKACQRFID